MKATYTSPIPPLAHQECQFTNYAYLSAERYEVEMMDGLEMARLQMTVWLATLKAAQDQTYNDVFVSYGLSDDQTNLFGRTQTVRP